MTHTTTTTISPAVRAAVRAAYAEACNHLDGWNDCLREVRQELNRCITEQLKVRAEHDALAKWLDENQEADDGTLGIDLGDDVRISTTYEAGVFKVGAAANEPSAASIRTGVRAGPPVTPEMVRAAAGGELPAIRQGEDMLPRTFIPAGLTGTPPLAAGLEEAADSMFGLDDAVAMIRKTERIKSEAAAASTIATVRNMVALNEAVYQGLHGDRAGFVNADFQGKPMDTPAQRGIVPPPRGRELPPQRRSLVARIVAKLAA